MELEKLSADQLQRILDQLAPLFAYVQKLRKRMDERDFPHDDPLRQLVTRLADTTHTFQITLHYMVCDKHSGRTLPRRSKGPRAYYVDFATVEGVPLAHIEHMPLVEAETPLEAIALMARHGRLPTAEEFVVRVVLSHRHGRAQEWVTVALSRKAVTPQSNALN